MKINILHITPHFGTGVGTVVRSYAKYVNSNDTKYHYYISIENINSETKKFFKKNKIGFKENIFKKKKTLLKLVKHSDVIIVHWWNHPLLMYILANWEFPKNRLVIWSHITGKYAPNCITKDIIKFPDKFVFTTPISKKISTYKKLSYKLKKNCDVIWSTGGYDRVKIYKKKRSEFFIVGYIGNLDYTKLHTNFVKMCEKASKKNTRFIIIGKKVNNSLLEEVKKSNQKNKFIFKGYVSEKEKMKLLSNFDVFGYPLSKYHFGSCDQSIQEAMTAKIPVVALNNQMESYMIKNNVTGYLAKDENEYSKIIKNFQKKKNVYKIVEKAQAYSKKNYSLKSMCEKWEKIFKEMMMIKKNYKKFSKTKLLPEELYSISLTDECKPIKKYLNLEGNIELWEKKVIKFCHSKNWISPTKSSPFHYLNFFPKNKILKKLCLILSKNLHPKVSLK